MEKVMANNEKYDCREEPIAICQFITRTPWFNGCRNTKVPNKTSPSPIKIIHKK